MLCRGDVVSGCSDAGPEDNLQSRIVFTIRLPQDSMRMVTVASDGSDLRTLLSGAGSRYGAQWSPDGREIAYLNYRSDRVDSAEVRIVRDDGTGDRRVLGPGPWGGGVDWAPDGRSLVIAEEQGDGRTRIATVELDGTGLTYLTDGASDGNPLWSPTGEYIAFSRH